MWFRSAFLPFVAIFIHICESYATDVIRYAKNSHSEENSGSRFSNRRIRYKLKGRITKFEIIPDEYVARLKSVTEYGELAPKAILLNDGPTEVSQNFTVHESRNDLVDVQVILGLTHMYELSVSNTASKNFTPGFRNILNKVFRNAWTDGNSAMREEFHSRSNTVHAEAGIPGFGVTTEVGVESGVKHDNAHSKSSRQHSEITSEENGFNQKVQNVETRIIEALTSCYQNARNNCRTNRKTKTFSIDKSILVPPCSRYVFSSFVKRTRDLPAIYTAYVEVTGVDGNGFRLTAADIRGKLRNLAYVRDKNYFTVIAMESSRLFVDFNWFSTYKGEVETMEGCLEKASLENFFNSDFIRNWTNMEPTSFNRNTTTAPPRSRFRVDTEELF